MRRAIEGVVHPVASYREFVPCPALQPHVYALFSFVPGSTPPPRDRPLLREVAFNTAAFCSPQFADGHVSMVFELGRTCDARGRWHADSICGRGTVLGPMSHVGRTEGSERPEMVGAYFRPAVAALFLRVAIADLTDHAIAIGDIWGAAGARLVSELCELDEASRIDRLESALLARLVLGRHRLRTVDGRGWRRACSAGGAEVSVEAMALAAGVSRQHLTWCPRAPRHFAEALLPARAFSIRTRARRSPGERGLGAGCDRPGLCGSIAHDCGVPAVQRADPACARTRRVVSPFIEQARALSHGKAIGASATGYQLPASSYSVLSATIGSRRAARRAGMKAATTATTARNVAAPKSVSGSAV